MADPNCGNCKFKYYNRQTSQLECRRYPPQVGFFLVPTGDEQRPVAVNNASTVPVVLTTNWCGEHRPALEIAHSLPDTPPPKAS